MKAFSAPPLGQPTASTRIIASTRRGRAPAFSNAGANPVRQLPKHDWQPSSPTCARRSTGGWVDDRYFGSFVEPGLRSPQHPMLRLFVASTLRGLRNLRAGNSKAHLLAIGSKLVLLDHAYVSFNPMMRRVIRIDLDQTFDSWDALRKAIQEVGVPPPNLAVAHVEADGRVVHPHGYWLLA